MDKTVNETIIRYSTELRLPAFRRDFSSLAKEAAKDHMEYEEFLVTLLEREYELRIENRKKSQIRLAGFPSKMYLQELQREQLPEDAHQKLPLLERLDFIE